MDALKLSRSHTDPSMATRLVARVLEVLVAELVLADELALAGLALSRRRSRAR